MFLGVVILMILGAVSCKKKSCYHCYYFFGYFIASKNSDTVTTGTIISRTWLQDSITHYISLGYTIDSVVGGYHPEDGPGAVFCDTNSVYNGQPVRDSCSAIN